MVPFWMSSCRLRHLSEHRQRESHEEDDHQHGAQEGGGLARQEEAHEEAVVAEPHTVGDPCLLYTSDAADEL